MRSKKPVKRSNPLDDPAFIKFVKEAEPNITDIETETEKKAETKIKTDATEKQVDSAIEKSLPWEGKEFSKKLVPFMNFSLDKKYIEKLRWVSNHSDRNQMVIIRDLLRPYLDTYISENTKGE
jgi:hypothetical protein